VFGGRSQDLDWLDEWLLDDEAPPRLLLLGPAGRGKTALLVHWLQRLQQCPPADCRFRRTVFIPISKRFGTDQSVVYLEALAAHVAEVLGKPLESPTGEPQAHYEEKIRELLDESID
jgi:hypothetical protein